VQGSAGDRLWRPIRVPDVLPGVDPGRPVPAHITAAPGSLMCPASHLAVTVLGGREFWAAHGRSGSAFAPGV